MTPKALSLFLAAAAIGLTFAGKAIAQQTNSQGLDFFGLEQPTAEPRLLNPFVVTPYSGFVVNRFGFPELASPELAGATSPFAQVDLPIAPTAVIAPSAEFTTPPTISLPVESVPAASLGGSGSSRPPFRPQVRSPFRPPPRPPF